MGSNPTPAAQQPCGTRHGDRACGFPWRRHSRRPCSSAVVRGFTCLLANDWRTPPGPRSAPDCAALSRVPLVPRPEQHDSRPGAVLRGDADPEGVAAQGAAALRCVVEFETTCLPAGDGSGLAAVEAADASDAERTLLAEPAGPPAVNDLARGEDVPAAAAAIGAGGSPTSSRMPCARLRREGPRSSGRQGMPPRRCLPLR